VVSGLSFVMVPRGGLLRCGVAVRGRAGAGVVRARAGGYAAAGSARRFLRVLGGRPAAARRVLSAWRLCQVVRMRWLRMVSRQQVQSMSGARRGDRQAVLQRWAPCEVVKPSLGSP